MPRSPAARPRAWRLALLGVVTSALALLGHWGPALSVARSVEAVDAEGVALSVGAVPGTPEARLPASTDRVRASRGSLRAAPRRSAASWRGTTSPPRLDRALSTPIAAVSIVGASAAWRLAPAPDRDHRAADGTVVGSDDGARPPGARAPPSSSSAS